MLFCRMFKLRYLPIFFILITTGFIGCKTRLPQSTGQPATDLPADSITVIEADSIAEETVVADTVAIDTLAQVEIDIPEVLPVKKDTILMTAPIFRNHGTCHPMKDGICLPG